MDHLDFKTFIYSTIVNKQTKSFECLIWFELCKESRSDEHYRGSGKESRHQRSISSTRVFGAKLEWTSCKVFLFLFLYPYSLILNEWYISLFEKDLTPSPLRWLHFSPKLCPTLIRRMIWQEFKRFLPITILVLPKIRWAKLRRA